MPCLASLQQSRPTGVFSHFWKNKFGVLAGSIRSYICIDSKFRISRVPVAILRQDSDGTAATILGTLVCMTHALDLLVAVSLDSGWLFTATADHFAQ